MSPRSPRRRTGPAAVVAAVLAGLATSVPAVGQAPGPPSGGSPTSRTC